MRDPHHTPPNPGKGYGNIYTPHAGSMIIQVQREGGLANRTIILSQGKVRALRFLMSRKGKILVGVLAVSWLFFAVQSLRVPMLTHRISTMERDAQRLDTLQYALVELTKRYEQVQGMLSASGTLPRSMQAPPLPAVLLPAPTTVTPPATAPAARTTPPRERATPATTTPSNTAGAQADVQQEPGTAPAAPPASPKPLAQLLAAASQAAASSQPASLPGIQAQPPDSLAPTLPSQWPLPAGTSRFITRGTSGEGPYNGPHPGLDVAVPVGTEIRAAGGGLVVEVGENEEYGKFLRIAHAGGYETLYAHTSQVLVKSGQRVPPGRLVAFSGNTGRSTAPHLHFEVRRTGQAVDPLQLIRQGL